MEDVRIIELFFARDEAALLETERKYGGRLTALACSITEDPQDAEECVNDTYLEVWQAIPPARPDRFFAFLAKILRHNALTVCEKRHAKKREGVTVELTRELAECLPDSYDPAAEEDSAAIPRHWRISSARRRKRRAGSFCGGTSTPFPSPSWRRRRG